MKNNILTERQAVLLKDIGANQSIVNNFYLTGGTALAAFYLGHRWSEDLDFFSEQEVDVLVLDVFFKQIKEKYLLKKIDFQQAFNRNLFFLHFSDEVLKTEFTFFPFPRIEKTDQIDNIQIDSLIDIATNKLFSIYQRTKARDYIDLFCICMEKDMPIANLIKNARIKFDTTIDLLQLGGKFIKASEVADYPRMIKEIEPVIWQNFFLDEAKKLKNQIIE